MEPYIAKCLVENKINLCMAAEYDYGNFGDLLSRYVIEKLSGKSIVKYQEDNTYHLCAIGSILERNEICCNTVVWGSGFLSPQPQWKIKLTYIRQLLRKKVGKPYYLAVRGTSSRDVLLKAGYECPDVYGDPALLMPLLYTPKTAIKKYNVGVVLHRKHKKLAKLFAKIESIKIIDIDRNYDNLEEFIDEVCSCKTIVSSSLHGIVIANTYKIPSVRLIIKGYPLGKTDARDLFKFGDYVSGLNANKYNIDAEEYVLNNISILPDKELEKDFLDEVDLNSSVPNYKINMTALVKAFPFLKEEYQDKEFIIS